MPEAREAFAKSIYSGRGYWGLTTHGESPFGVHNRIKPPSLAPVESTAGHLQGGLEVSGAVHDLEHCSKRLQESAQLAYQSPGFTRLHSHLDLDLSLSTVEEERSPER